MNIKEGKKEDYEFEAILKYIESQKKHKTTFKEEKEKGI